MSPATLLGTWEMIRAQSEGEPSSDLLALRIEFELTADTYTVRFAGELADRGAYTLAPDTLTLVGTEGPNAGRTIPCIYRLVGDRLRICYGMDGVAPEKFATAAGDQRYLATYRRKSDTT